MVAPVNIGSSSTVVGGTVTITVGAGGVPAGAQIFVDTSDNGTGTGGMADTAGNSYGNTHTSNTGIGLTLWRARPGTGGGLALVNGNTIVYTVVGTLAAVRAFYVVGLVDAGADVSATNTGSSASPSATSPTPNFPGNFFVGVVGGATLISSFTQDTTNAAWDSTSPPAGSVSNAAPVLAMGVVVNPNKTALTYNPAFGTSDVWAAIISSYQVAPVDGWETKQSDMPSRSATVRRAGAAVRSRSEFGIFPNFVPMGWEPNQVQLTRRRVVDVPMGPQGLAPPAPATTPAWGFEPALPSPPRPRHQRSGATARGDDGTQATFAQFFGFGWPVAPVQPPHPRAERSGALAKGDDGLAQLIQFIAPGWHIAPFQPPHPRRERAGAVMTGEQGNEAVFVFVAPTTPAWGYDPQFQPPRPRRDRGSAIKARSEFGIFPNLAPFGWNVHNVQPQHPRPERAGAVQAGEQGNEAVFIPTVVVAVPWGYAFEWQPPHPRPERSGAVSSGDQGNEAIFVAPVSAPVSWGFVFDWQPPAYRPAKRAGGLASSSEFAIPSPLVNGWEIQFTQLIHPRRERAGAIQAGDAGNEAVFVPPSVGTPTWGYVFDWQPPAYRPANRGAAIAGSSDYAIPSPVGWWEVQHTHLPRRAPRMSGIMRGDDGNYDVLRQWLNAGWEVQPPPPPHPRRERAGAVMRGDDGTAATLIQFLPMGWTVAPFQPGHPRPERAAAVMAGDPGNENVFAFFVAPPTAGWEFVPPLTVHPRPERSGAIARGHDGTDLPFAVWRNAGWEVAPFQPPHPRPEQRAGAIMRGDDGAQATFAVWLNAGWEVAYTHVPHPRRERSGALMAGDPGNEATMPVVQFPNGWEVASAIAKHPRPERGAAIMRGDDGTQATFVRWLNVGWEVAPVQPPHPRPERSGALAKGDDGTAAAFVPPPPLLAWGYEPTIQARRRPNTGAALAPWLIEPYGPMHANVTSAVVSVRSYGAVVFVSGAPNTTTLP